MKKMTQTLIGSVLATAGLLAATSAMAGKTLDQIKQRGQIVCGVNTGRPDFRPLTPAATGRAWMWTTAVPWPQLC